ncbi:peptidase dimerization domain-containing protein [Ktedonosporobacter rubrisoli]|nr:peptidase dimerization domain-containing protein [Ktedonosporobacter rubrisoli]
MNIKWLFDATGEPGHPAMLDVVAQHQSLFQADGCIGYATDSALIGAPYLALGTKGYLSLELFSRTTPRPVSSSHGAVVPGAAWRLLWALNQLKNSQEEILLEGFYDNVIALEDETMEQLYNLPDNASSLAQHWKLDQLLLGLKGFQLHYAHLLTPSCSINTLHAGASASKRSRATLPAQAKACVDFYLVPAQDPDDIASKLREHLQAHDLADIQVRVLQRNWPIYTPLAMPFVQKVQHALSHTSAQGAVLLPLTIGSYPLYPLYKFWHMPVVIIGTSIVQESASLAEIDPQELALLSKQTHMIIEELANATDTN